MDCLFCKIISGDIPSHVVYQDDNSIAVLDIQPRAPGHVMVLPRRHADNILEVPSADLGAIFQGVQNVTTLLKEKLGPDGFTIGINHGRVSGQTVDHLHIHIIPRWFSDKGDSIHSVVNNPPTESLEEIANKLRG
ncbi:MAG: HIT family protein [bacterium]|nr:HIT family protein [bacterium]